jgi:hypothetical protein
MIGCAVHFEQLSLEVEADFSKMAWSRLSTPNAMRKGKNI